MSIESNLRTLTLQNPAVVAAIGNRFFIDHIPEVSGGMTYPLVRAQTITDPFEHSHSGTVGGRARVQLDVYDDDPTTRDTTADAIIAWLDNYNGALGNYNVIIQVKNRATFREPDSRLFRRMIEVEILYYHNV